MKVVRFEVKYCSLRYCVQFIIKLPCWNLFLWYRFSRCNNLAEIFVGLASFKVCSFMLKPAFSTPHVQALLRMIWNIMVYVSLHHIWRRVKACVKGNGCQGLFVAKQNLYSQYSISVLGLLNSFLQSSVTNKRDITYQLLALPSPQLVETQCITVTPRWRLAVTFAEKRKFKVHQRQQTLSTTQNHHICVPWALFSIRKSGISEKTGYYSSAVFIFITQALTTFTHVALWKYSWWKLSKKPM